MKALTLHQPWASLVAIGAKRIETRSWSTSYRGLLAIHAAKLWNDQLWRIASTGPIGIALLEARNGPDLLPLGMIVARCRLHAVARIQEDYPMDDDVAAAMTPRERAFGDFTPGRFAWLLADVEALPQPIPARGRQGLWDA